MKTETLNINGQEFFVRLWGNSDNPPLLLLHGFPEYGAAWQEVAEHLSDTYYCIAPDQRGFGQSWKPVGAEHYRMHLLVQDAIGIMAHYSQNKPIFLLGHDWGAAVAYIVASAVPKMVKKLIILNGVHPIPFQAELAKGGSQAEASQYINWLRRDDSAEQLAANDFAKMLALLRENMDSTWFTSQKVEAYKTEWARENAMQGMVNWYKASPVKVPPLGKSLKDSDMVAIDPQKMRIKMPHLVVWGKKDTALTIECRNGIYDLCDDVKIVELEELDHWLHHQNPKLVADSIGEFLA